MVPTSGDSALGLVGLDSPTRRWKLAGVALGLAGAVLVLMALASTAWAGSLKLSVPTVGGQHLIRASGTYDVSPTELDVYVHSGTAGCPSTRAAENARVQRQVQTLGVNAAGLPIYYRFGTGLVMSGSYAQQAYWGLGAQRGTYWACGYLLVPPNPGRDPADPPQATASAQFTIGRPPPRTCPAAGGVVMLRDGRPIRSSRVTVVAGQPIRLGVARCRNARWEVGGATTNLNTTSAVRDYLVENAGDASRIVVEYIRAPALPKAFYFIRPNSHGYRVIVRTCCAQDSHVFVVEAPRVVKPLFSTCTVAFDQVGSIQTAVGPGWNRSCPGGPGDPLGVGRPGIEWSFAVQANHREAGTLAMIQLISKDVTHDTRPCPGLSTRNRADVTAFYDAFAHPSRAYIGLAAGRVNTWRDRDSPRLGQLRDRLGRWYESFYARDYLMYKSTAASSRWVALGSTQWSWNVTVTRGNAGWSGSTTNIAPPSFDPGASPPQFFGGFTDGPAGC